MNEQTDKGNKYTYDGRIDKQGQSICRRWTYRETRVINIPKRDEQTEKVNQYTYDRLTERQGQSIYLPWTIRQTRAINIPSMENS
jgi:hypothetical protein